MYYLLILVASSLRKVGGGDEGESDAQRGSAVTRTVCWPTRTGLRFWESRRVVSNGPGERMGPGDRARGGFPGCEGVVEGNHRARRGIGRWGGRCRRRRWKGIVVLPGARAALARVAWVYKRGLISEKNDRIRKTQPSDDLHREHPHPDEFDRQSENDFMFLSQVWRGKYLRERRRRRVPRGVRGQAEKRRRGRVTIRVRVLL